MYDYYEAVSEAASARAENELASDEAVNALREALDAAYHDEGEQENALMRVPEEQRRRIIQAFEHMDACAGAALPQRHPDDMARWDHAIDNFDAECERAGITPGEALDCL